MDDEQRHPAPEEQVEDLDVPPDESREVKGGVAVGDVNGDGSVSLQGDPDQPIVVGKVPGLRKSTDVTLKRG